MNPSPKVVRFDDDKLWVSLADGRTIAAPLAWFPRLLQATPAQRAQIEYRRSGWRCNPTSSMSTPLDLAAFVGFLSGYVLRTNPTYEG